MTGHGNNLLGVVIILGARHRAGVGWPGAVLGPRGSGGWVSFPRHGHGVGGCGSEGRVRVRDSRLEVGCRLMGLAGGVRKTRRQGGGIHMGVPNCDGAGEFIFRPYISSTGPAAAATAAARGVVEQSAIVRSW